MKKAKVIGCGLSGIVSAILLKNKGYDVKIFDKRSHIGGNCYDKIKSGTLMHEYGPHIFHTDDEEVFSFLSKYTDWIDFKLQPKGNSRLGLISLPYSKKTISEIGRELSQEEILEYIFKEYSEKQWGVPFDQIPSTITNRIPKTKDCEDPTWFEGQKYQCVPKEGYTKMFDRMLLGIEVQLNSEDEDWQTHRADLTIYTGKIDEFFKFKHGKLPYRSLLFDHKTTESKMPHFIENQNNSWNKYTRVYDHRFFQPHKINRTTIITKEYSVLHDDSNIPFYPIPFGDGQEIYQKYKLEIQNEPNTIFIGRLATYKYLDMWMAIRSAMNIINKVN